MKSGLFSVAVDEVKVETMTAAVVAKMGYRTAADIVDYVRRALEASPSATIDQVERAVRGYDVARRRIGKGDLARTCGEMIRVRDSGRCVVCHVMKERCECPGKPRCSVCRRDILVIFRGDAIVGKDGRLMHPRCMERATV